ncbi:hypothetical protein E0Z10_g7021 [Xylaria hypoxylon]|uniref:Uncharacterized protein n=1 Tax=Xylaria hypoxylon TaxID=37992 RepID=A0A4Z0YCN6_9PEZI|nr:hypothetical protein E0Z10_g7021 [Xylaria hypoxylon]
MQAQRETLTLDVLFQVAERLDTHLIARLSLVNQDLYEAIGRPLLRKTLQKEKENFLFKHVYSTTALKHFIQGGFAREFDTVRHVAVTCRTENWQNDLDVEPFDLLKLHYNINARNTENCTVISSIIATHPSPATAVEALLGAGADPNGGAGGAADLAPLNVLFAPGRWAQYPFIQTGPVLLQCVKALVSHGASTTPEPHGVDFLFAAVLNTIWEKLCLVAKQAALEFVYESRISQVVRDGALHVQRPGARARGRSRVLGRVIGRRALTIRSRSPVNESRAISIGASRSFNRQELILSLERVDTKPYDELCNFLVDATPAWQELTPGLRGQVLMLKLLSMARLRDVNPWSIHLMGDGLFYVNRENVATCRPGVTFNRSDNRWVVDYNMS